ncbi:FixH family protein [Algivirga pacifica]|uniref:YtkA-like domain-containing protein n=1 Tax=Algivirga pacifica TaxID=1162670 RepID=A0ABP9DFH3_9BACT
MKNIYIVFAIAFAFLFTACSEENTVDPMLNYTKVETITLPNTGLEATVWSVEETLFAGYNKMMVTLQDAEGNAVTTPSVKWMPMMAMDGGHSHSAPTDQPVLNADNGVYEGGVTFVMPSMGGAWTLMLEVTEGEQMDMHTLPITVMDKNSTFAIQQANYQTIIRKQVGETRYFFAYYFKEDMPRVGEQEIVIAAYKMMPMDHGSMRTAEGMMDHGTGFMPVTDLSIELEAYMPSMGHGAPEGQQPMHKMHGHYEGTINFNMTGDWQLKTRIKMGEEVLVNSMDVEEDLSFYLEF